MTLSRQRQNYAIAEVPGLFYVPEYLSYQERDILIATIDQQPWLTVLKRRVQHYGYRYDYTQRRVDASMFLGSLPPWAISLAERIYRDDFTSRLPDQLIVNEYEPGQGISSHIDCLPCFEDTILLVSLGSCCIMLFTHSRTQQRVSVLLEPGSLVVMSGEARRVWKHGIPPRKTDVYGGQRIIRRRRLSLTFRNIRK